MYVKDELVAGRQLTLGFKLMIQDGSCLTVRKKHGKMRLMISIKTKSDEASGLLVESVGQQDSK